MKKFNKILVASLFGLLLVVPAFVWAHGWGMGGRGHMMGFWGPGPNGYDQDDQAYGSLSREQEQQLTELNRKFYDDTRELRTALWSKTAELNGLLAGPAPEADKVAKVQKEVSDLRAQLDQKVVSHEIEVRKIAPDAGPGFGYGHMMGGYGHMMGGYGPGSQGGYGPGACWN